MSTANIIIPAKNAGIGDLVYGTRADHIVIARGTANADTINSKPIYGGIYGFVAGYAMVTAPEDLEGTKTWGTAVEGTPTFTADPLMRNGLRATITQMNTARDSGFIAGGSQSPAPTLITTAYKGTPLSSSTFDTQATEDIKKRFGSWDEYIRQTLRINGVPGTPFGATTTGVKVHEFGRYMGMLCGPGSAVGTAMRDCYDYGYSIGENYGDWWVPSMFELGELMIDEHLNKINENPGVSSGWQRITVNDHRWSCVCYGGVDYAVWLYYSRGYSRGASTANTFYVRPVTLLKL